MIGAALGHSPHATPGAAYREEMNPDGADLHVPDEIMLEEIELVADLVVAASSFPTRRLTLEEIDRALGLVVG